MYLQLAKFKAIQVKQVEVRAFALLDAATIVQPEKLGIAQRLFVHDEFDR